MLKQLTKASLKRYYNLCLKVWSWGVSKNYDIKNTVVICGAPRSGTTWLFEMLLRIIPRSFGIFEPLHLTSHKRVQKVGFSWRPYIAPGQSWPEAEKLFADILHASKINLWDAYQYPMRPHVLSQLAKANTYIVKFCRANRLLKWMVETYPVKPPILLIRHPCAVVASRLGFDWDHLKRSVSIPEHLKELPRINKIAKKLSTIEEQVAFEWCLDYYIPLSEPKPHPWTLVTYEKLVTDGVRELDRLMESLGCEATQDFSELLKRPSAAPTSDSSVAQGKSPLSNWRSRLNWKQQNRILSVVAEFGLDFYSEKLEPDYERLRTEPIRR